MDPTQLSNAGLQSLNNNNRLPANLPTDEVVSSQDPQSQTPVVPAELSPVSVPIPPVAVSSEKIIPAEVAISHIQPVVVPTIPIPVIQAPPIPPAPPVPATPTTPPAPPVPQTNPIPRAQRFSLIPQIPVVQKPASASVPIIVPKPVSHIPRPPVVVATTPPVFFNNNFLAQSQSQSHSHWKMIVAIVLIVIVLGGVGAYAGYTYMFSFDHSILPAIGKIDSAELIHSGIKISLDSSDLMFNGSSLSVATDIDRSMNSSESVKTGIVVDLVNPSLSASAELRFIDNVIYGRISKFPALYASYLSAVGNKWYSISLDTIKTAGSSYGVASTTSEIKPISPSEAYNRLVSAGVLKDQKFVGIKTYSGSYVRQYSITIDKNALASLTDSVPSIGQQNAYEQQAKALAKQQMDQIVFGPIIVNLDLWSGSLRSIEMSVSYTPTVKDSIAKAMTAKILLTYDDSMKTLSIDVPEGVTAMDSYINDSLRSAADKGKDASIISKVSQVRMEIEKYYNTTSKGYLGGCKSSNNITLISASLKESGSTYACRDSEKAYIIYTSLLTKVGTTTSYCCMDSTGLSTTTKKVPTKFVCK